MMYPLLLSIPCRTNIIDIAIIAYTACNMALPESAAAQDWYFPDDLLALKSRPRARQHDPIRALHSSTLANGIVHTIVYGTESVQNDQ